MAKGRRQKAKGKRQKAKGRRQKAMSKEQKSGITRIIGAKVKFDWWLGLLFG
jgi:hypothetical protein